jgi:hypothetical protein
VPTRVPLPGVAAASRLGAGESGAQAPHLPASPGAGEGRYHSEGVPIPGPHRGEPSPLCSIEPSTPATSTVPPTHPLTTPLHVCERKGVRVELARGVRR